jgi:hypothetical protein
VRAFIAVRGSGRLPCPCGRGEQQARLGPGSSAQSPPPACPGLGRSRSGWQVGEPPTRVQQGQQGFMGKDLSATEEDILPAFPSSCSRSWWPRFSSAGGPPLSQLGCLITRLVLLPVSRALTPERPGQLPGTAGCTTAALSRIFWGPLYPLNTPRCTQATHDSQPVHLPLTLPTSPDFEHVRDIYLHTVPKK